LFGIFFSPLTLFLEDYLIAIRNRQRAVGSHGIDCGSIPESVTQKPRRRNTVGTESMKSPTLQGNGLSGLFTAPKICNFVARNTALLAWMGDRDDETLGFQSIR
jgi:hypothetical protein